MKRPSAFVEFLFSLLCAQAEATNKAIGAQFANILMIFQQNQQFINSTPQNQKCGEKNLCERRATDEFLKTRRKVYEFETCVANVYRS